MIAFVYLICLSVFSFVWKELPPPFPFPSLFLADPPATVDNLEMKDPPELASVLSPKTEKHDKVKIVTKRNKKYCSSPPPRSS